MSTRFLCVLLLALTACGTGPGVQVNTVPTSGSETVSASSTELAGDESASMGATDVNELAVADVVSVAVSGEPGNYTFAVTLSSADTGCKQYADWWEVADLATGDLIYRRVLAHSHVDEQPFTRSGGPVPIESDQSIIIRGHMGGVESRYGGKVLGGTVDAGFQLVEDSVASLESVEPLPQVCAF